jgi:thiosulfate reductase cytochrome b subunit
MVNGIVFVILLLVTGQWMRIVPTSWEIIPNAAAVALQYFSLDWPSENSWLSYNALQLLMYFVTVFLAAPIAALTGYRLSVFWPQQNQKLARLFSFNAAVKLHFAVMVYFVLFIVVHVTLVFATGAVKNLNHMFAATESDGPAGVVNFILGLVAVIATWFLVRPATVRRFAAMFGNVR